MAKGDAFPSERIEFRDVETDARVQQLTNHKGNSHHLYFTNAGWYDGGRKLVVGSDRQNATNLYGVDLESGELRQLTDLPDAGSGTFLSTSVNPARDEAYYWFRGRLVALDLDTLEERVLYEVPEGFKGSGCTNVTADGRYVCVNVTEDVNDKLAAMLGPDYHRLSLYPGFAEHVDLHPLSQVVRIPVDGSPPNVAWEENHWIGHINTSPGRADLLTFCHEGPWDLVDHRIWGLDIENGKAWKIRPTEPGERVGHEYWQADGEHIGYHGTLQGRPFLGSINYDNTDQQEMETVSVQHCHSNDVGLVVGDGQRDFPQLVLWRSTGDAWDKPRTLHTHRGSFHVQHVHVHPRFNAAGNQIVFTSDHNGYGNVFLIDVPDDVEALPVHERPR
ncbi:oligogalacturonate lyase family protein [Tenggerimyces flavus]|uniref:Oligogalacturonate lyase family protein n=1 Tax=Tenggerimyces flavus TaxID=1708749 RepID=A0ABV7YK54_9ACTN|nr:oligogalacturonate lyase family protein [Tenggerimyces flavus]MBM7789659.1 oligogalacturonide lyase [Tenggerimyces flavus]